MDKKNIGKKMQYDIDILKSQYEIAVDVYKHEDNLNWNKLYNFFYINGALIFILGYILNTNKSFPYNINPSLLTILCIVGIVASLCFTIVISSGTVYLQARKNKVIKIEKKLKEFGGTFVIGDFGGSKRKKQILKVSPTTLVLKLIPCMFTFGWIILLCISILLLF